MVRLMGAHPCEMYFYVTCLDLCPEFIIPELVNFVAKLVILMLEMEPSLPLVYGNMEAGIQ